jgi:hypothetical protein
MTKVHDDNDGESLWALPDALKVTLKEAALKQSGPQQRRAKRARALIGEASEKRRRIQALREKSRKLLYGAMGDAMELLCLAMTSKEVRAQIREAAKEAEIAETKGTPMALLLAKLCIGADEAAASQQAQALNGALLKQIAPDKLRDHLETEGIAKLAAYFRQEQGGGSGGSGGAEAASRREMPKLDFSDRGLRNFLKAEDQGALAITMTASRADADAGGWVVERVTIGTAKEQ